MLCEVAGISFSTLPKYDLRKRGKVKLRTGGKIEKGPSRSRGPGNKTL